MIEFEKPNITKIDENKDYGVFVVEPLERGYGTTLGNSLRRVLLASLPGAAVTQLILKVYCTNLIQFQVSAKTLCKSFLTLKGSL